MAQTSNDYIRLAADLQSDSIVDGPFNVEERDFRLLLSGSKNQRFIDINK